ncbi:MAG: hypothetical protein ACLQSR_15325 [Limisphaerales bacterium]
MAEKTPRRFDFARDTFAFANELLWEYQFDAATKRMTFRRREPTPQYAHRCFVLTRVARQFLYHARFDNSQPLADDCACRGLIRSIIHQNPRVPSDNPVVIPGFSSLRDFSQAKETLLKAECGGAWRSYFLRSHWRIIFPLSPEHQQRTAGELLSKIQNDFSPIIHLITFPSLTINHGMILFEAMESGDEIHFSAYDPNLPGQPAAVTYHRGRRVFSLPANSYWAGGTLKVMEIFRNRIF